MIMAPRDMDVVGFGLLGSGDGGRGESFVGRPDETSTSKMAGNEMPPPASINKPHTNHQPSPSQLRYHQQSKYMKP